MNSADPKSSSSPRRQSRHPARARILVQIAAAGLNPVDAAVRAGYYRLLGNPPFTVGWDISGTVEALGSGVDGFAVGDAVFGMPRFPEQAAAYAEKIVAPAAELAGKPESLDQLRAAALPLAGLTAWQGLVRAAGLKSGQRVLIHGAAGGVGHLAVQIAKAQGAEIVATASASKLDFVRGLGADTVIDYGKDDFTELARDIDVALETVGGDHAWPAGTAGTSAAGSVTGSRLSSEAWPSCCRSRSSSSAA